MYHTGLGYRSRPDGAESEVAFYVSLCEDGCDLVLMSGRTTAEVARVNLRA